MHKITYGDVVYLKSGGPSMTVSHRDSSTGLYVVVWFEGGVLNSTSVSIEAIEIAE